MGEQLALVPALPRMRAIATQLRSAWRNAPADGWTVSLTLDHEGWRCTADTRESPRFGSEHVPHHSVAFDAVGAARRILAAADDALNPRLFG